jgi:hypothetical protein
MACAANVSDSDLRATFLSSKAVREVIAGAADHPQIADAVGPQDQQ